MLDYPKPLIVYDGFCAMCHGFVGFVLRNDNENKFYYTARQSELGQKIREQNNLQDVESILLCDEDGIHIYSDASLKILKKLGRPYSLLYLLAFIPKFIRDTVYLGISKMRYKIFGKKDVCYMPSPEARKKFII
jgi:predicted DCC family thiol-disulfide oxidoreductase YuxK